MSWTPGSGLVISINQICFSAQLQREVGVRFHHFESVAESEQDERYILLLLARRKEGLYGGNPQ
jgi:hypothetical protein